MKRLRRWLSHSGLLVILALVLAIPLMIVLRDVVRDVIVYPLARLFWLIRLVFLGIPPIFIWGYFLLVALRIILRGIRTSSKRSRPPQAEIRPAPRRVGMWARRIRLTRQGAYSSWRLAHHLGDLAAQVLAANERRDVTESRRRLQAGSWEAPENVRAYFRAATGPAPLPPPRSFFGRLWHRLRGRPRAEKPRALDTELRAIVTFLEGQVGIAAPEKES